MSVEGVGGWGGGLLLVDRPDYDAMAADLDNSDGLAHFDGHALADGVDRSAVDRDDAAEEHFALGLPRPADAGP